MVDAAPTLGPRLVAEVERLARTRLWAAEINRRVGAKAADLGVAKPSYETVRLLVNEFRRRPKRPAAAEVVVDVALRARAPEARLDHVAGVGVPTRR